MSKSPLQAAAEQIRLNLMSQPNCQMQPPHEPLDLIIRRHLVMRMPPEDLVMFLYLLARDHLVTGAVEKIMLDIEKTRGTERSYCSATQEQWAREVADRLTFKEMLNP